MNHPKYQKQSQTTEYRLCLYLALVAIALLLITACGSTAEQAAVDVNATVAAAVAATKTANPPTDTPPPPTDTPTPEPTSTPTYTSTPKPPTPTRTRTPKPTNTPRPTATPSPDAVVNVDVGNLRAGPGTNYDVIDQVSQGDKIEILGKNSAGDWVRVRTNFGARSGRKTGWLSITLLEINIPLSDVSVANIPPTPTSSIPTATPTPKICPAVPALVQIRNYLEVGLTIQFSGADQFTVTIPSKDVRNICVPPGNYATTSSASGYSTDYDTETFTIGACSCWDFYTGFFTPDCKCPTGASSYFRP